jgi:hypothetical protein
MPATLPGPPHHLSLVGVSFNGEFLNQGVPLMAKKKTVKKKAVPRSWGDWGVLIGSPAVSVGDRARV